MAMIPLKHMAAKTVGVLGLGATGIAAAKALAASGAQVTVWDDNADARSRAASQGLVVGQLADRALDVLVTSPGIALSHPVQHAAIAHAYKIGATVVGDVELFAQARSALPAHKVVSITGTNGKSTTTALIAHILNSAGKDAVIGGNFGPPVLSLDAKECVYVLELSSFQLEQTGSLVSDVAVFLNLTPDHSDRYARLEDYAAAKQRLFDMQGGAGTAVIAIDDAEGLRLAAAARNTVVKASASGEAGAQWFVRDGALYHGETRVAGQAEWPDLQGPHNAQNVAVAAATCHVLGVTPAQIVLSLQDFKALAHRSQPVGQRGAIQFVNDSKATNPDAAAKALQAFPAIHWLAGGSDKGSDYAHLAPYLGAVKAGYFFGQTKTALKAALPGLNAALFETLDDAFSAAVTQARTEQSACTVLLSPASASFDQFKSFVHRGEAFTQLVQALDEGAA